MKRKFNLSYSFIMLVRFECYIISSACFSSYSIFLHFFFFSSIFFLFMHFFYFFVFFTLVCLSPMFELNQVVNVDTRTQTNTIRF